MQELCEDLRYFANLTSVLRKQNAEYFLRRAHKEWHLEVLLTTSRDNLH